MRGNALRPHGDLLSPGRNDHDHGPETSGVHSLAITGGTGRFLGARGEVVLNSIDPISDQVKFRILKPR
jgi:hypothetical protein